MTYIEDYRLRYRTETGDEPPVRPKRLYRKRFPVTVFTKAGQQYFAECDQYEIRFLKWLDRQLRGGPTMG